ncbi:hypothetical protein [Caldifermentibacillus hisashii]|uniref:hypothetical protein n=1 Tax=Caldifermentibacillus hisashii TaxID=996558 RepID=UPI0033672F72
MTWLISDEMHESFVITKLATRKGLVAKKGKFSLQIGDEIEFRRQNRTVFTSNW